MMPKEKAEELVDKLMNTFYKTQEFVWKSTAKHCALIAVDEILKIIHTNMEDKYWEEVKQEIEKL